MSTRTFYILSDSNQFSLSDKNATLPVVFIEKHRAFQIIDSKPFFKEVGCDLIHCGCRVNSFVWISHKKKAIYFENPKVASSSIKAALSLPEPDLLTCLVRIFSEWHALNKYVMRINDYSNTLTDQHVQDTVQRMNDIAANQTFYVGKQAEVINYSANDAFELYFGDRCSLSKTFSDYFAFGIVRHPFDRFMSNYLMFTQKNYRIVQLELMSRQKKKNMSLSDFLNVTQTINNHHWNTQSRFIPESITDFDCHYLGKLENFHEDWSFICEQIGTAFIHPHINTTDQHEFKSDEIEQGQKAINEIYKEDFNRFNY